MALYTCVEMFNQDYAWAVATIQTDTQGHSYCATSIYIFGPWKQNNFPKWKLELQMFTYNHQSQVMTHKTVRTFKNMQPQCFQHQQYKVTPTCSSWDQGLEKVLRACVFVLTRWRDEQVMAAELESVWHEGRCSRWLEEQTRGDAGWLWMG